MLAKLSELMFVKAMRRYVELLPPDGRGWLAGVRDVHVGRALALLHGKPERWTGSTCCAGDLPSPRNGYESEAAFSPAFKREFGTPPAAWRKAKPS